MPKLLLFFGSFQIGGIERAMVNLTRCFVEAGIEVTLAPLRKEGPLRDALPAGVQIEDFKPRQNTFYALPDFIHAIQSCQPDAILSAHANINILAIWARRLTGSHARLVVSEHSHLSMASNSGPRLSLRYRARLERWFYPLADAIVAVSHGVADDLAASTGISRQKVTVIYNPVVTPEIAALMRAPVAQSLFPPSAPVILGVGRLVDEKNFALLIRAFAELRSRRRARLVLLGEGPQRVELEKLVAELRLQDEVDLPGAARNPYAYMARAALVALSSKYEGLPTVIVESLACGTPVVATDCPAGPAEILDGGRFGRLVAVGDAMAMARAIEQTLDEPPDRPRLQQRAALFSAQNSASQYLRLLLPDFTFPERQANHG
jgi:glycosyltransferase involved in cell wall biosynthesis